MKAKVTMKNEYRDHELMFAAKYNSYYDIYYLANSNTDTFGFIIVDKLDKEDPINGHYLMMYNNGEFVFKKCIDLFLLNIECIYKFIKETDIRINGMGLAHIINLKKNKLI